MLMLRKEAITIGSIEFCLIQRMWKVIEQEAGTIFCHQICQKENCCQIAKPNSQTETDGASTGSLDLKYDRYRKYMKSNTLFFKCHILEESHTTHLIKKKK